MSENEQLTADEQENRQGPRQRLLKSKSRGKKSNKKNHYRNKDESSSDHQFQVDIPIQQQELNKRRLEQSKLNSTTSKQSDNQLKINILNQNRTGIATIQKQTKLNYFMLKKKGDISSESNTTERMAIKQPVSSQFAPPQSERRRASLQVKLSQKQALIQKMRRDRDINAQKYTRLKMETQQSKRRQRLILEKQLKQNYVLVRLQKAQINPKMGYYKQNSWAVFVQGNYLYLAQKRVNDIQVKIKQVEQQKKLTRQQFQRQVLNNQLIGLARQKLQALSDLKYKQSQVNLYKQRLRLADKEANCFMAKNHWNTIKQRYLPLELLGSGGFGEVYKCYDLEKHAQVALKMNCFEPLKGDESKREFIKHVQRQVQTLKVLSHRNIAKLIDEFVIDDKISFVMEYCSGPELNKYLARNQHLEQKQARSIIKQIAAALKYMYEQKTRIIHYDLKPANIIFHNGDVKILDFGLCKKMKQEQTKIDLTSQGVGTYWYLPPQTFEEYAEITSKVDVWSTGVIFYELLYGKRPFGQGMNQSKIFQEGVILKASKVDFPTQKKYKVSDQAKQFIRACLKYKVQQRLDPYQLFYHQYLNK